MRNFFILAIGMLMLESVLAVQLNVEVGAQVWNDRDYVFAEVPAGIVIRQAVDQLDCDSRKIRFPQGCERALIAMYDCAASTAIARSAQMRPYPGKLRVVRAKKRNAAGDTYRLWVIEKPSKPIDTTATTAGGILLAVNDDVPSADKLGPAAETAAEAREVPANLSGIQKVAGQEYRFRPGARDVEFYIRAPKTGITAETGLMLVSHNWGGTWKMTAPWCDILADRFNLICMSVNYLQSGEAVHNDVPYDHGLLQACDCLRALFEVQNRLDAAGIKFNRRRIYAAGASGGGNVSLMVNKLAPATFACIIDLCGMPGLTDEIAYGKCRLNAGYSQDPASPKYLTPAMQEIRDPGNLAHLKIQYAANSANQVVIVHGLNDTSCSVADKMVIASQMTRAGFRPATHFLTPADIDGKIVTNIGHDIGNRPEVIAKFGGPYMNLTSKFHCQLNAPSNLDAKNDVVYPVTGGRYVISFKGAPTVRFEAGK